eukprot:SAG31_NODE_3570_length_4116_cov_2.768982_1_plen_1158_part_00
MSTEQQLIAAVPQIKSTTLDAISCAGNEMDDYESDDSDSGYDPVVCAVHEKHNATIHALAKTLEDKNISLMEQSMQIPPAEPNQLSVHIATANIGNEMPPVTLHPWIPSGGMGSSIVVACGQEATYGADGQIRENVIGHLQGIIISAKDLVPPDSKQDCDPFCVLSLESDFPASKGKPDKSKQMAHTETWHIKGDNAPVTNPVWDAHFDIDNENPEKFLKQHKSTSREAEIKHIGPAAKKQAIPFLDVLPSTRRLRIVVFDWDQNSGNDKIGEYVEEFDTVPLLGGLQATNGITKVPDISKLKEAMAKLSANPVELKLKDKTSGFVTLKIDYTEMLPIEHMVTQLEQERELRITAMANRIQERSKCQGTVSIHIVRACDLLAADMKSRGQQAATSDPYCDVFSVDIHGQAIKIPKGTTKVMKKNVNPVWQHIVPDIQIDQTITGVEIKVMDHDQLSADDNIGQLYLPAEYFASLAGQPVTERMFFLSCDDQSQGQLVLEISFTPSEPPNTSVHIEYDEPLDDPDDFFNRVIHNVGSAYEVVGHRLGTQALLKKKFGQMKIVVLAKKSILPFMSGSRWDAENTGFAGLRNKGGIVARVNYMGSPICFVSSHLAAHEGIKHCRERKEMAKQIHREARPGHRGSTLKLFDLGNQFDHIVWAGDLNFRQEDERWFSTEWQGELDEKDQHLKKIDDIKRLIASEDWKALRDNDELRREMKIGEIFAGFKDCLAFDGSVLPTFKMVRGKSYRYHGQRVPSYTDRILTSSSPGAAQCIHKEFFRSVPTIGTSDHKMVFARLRISVPTPLFARSVHKGHPSNRRCVLHLDKVKYTCFTDWLPIDGEIKMEFFTPVSMLLGRCDGAEAKSYVVTGTFPTADRIQQYTKSKKKCICCGSQVQDGKYTVDLTNVRAQNQSYQTLDFAGPIIIPTVAPSMEQLATTVKSPIPGSNDTVVYSEALSVRITDGHGNERGFGRISLRDVAPTEEYSWGGMFELQGNDAEYRLTFSDRNRPSAIAVLPIDHGEELLDSARVTASTLFRKEGQETAQAATNGSVVKPDSSRAYLLEPDCTLLCLAIPFRGKYAIFFNDLVVEADTCEWFMHDLERNAVHPIFDISHGQECISSSSVDPADCNEKKAMRKCFREELTLNGAFFAPLNVKRRFGQR